MGWTTVRDRVLTKIRWPMRVAAVPRASGVRFVDPESRVRMYVGWSAVAWRDGALVLLTDTGDVRRVHGRPLHLKWSSRRAWHVVTRARLRAFYRTLDRGEFDFRRASPERGRAWPSVGSVAMWGLFAAPLLLAWFVVRSGEFHPAALPVLLLLIAVALLCAGAVWWWSWRTVRGWRAGVTNEKAWVRWADGTEASVRWSDARSLRCAVHERCFVAEREDRRRVWIPFDNELYRALVHVQRKQFRADALADWDAEARRRRWGLAVLGIGGGVVAAAAVACNNAVLAVGPLPEPPTPLWRAFGGWLALVTVYGAILDWCYRMLRRNLLAT